MSGASVNLEVLVVLMVGMTRRLFVRSAGAGASCSVHRSPSPVE